MEPEELLRMWEHIEALGEKYSLESCKTLSEQSLLSTFTLMSYASEKKGKKEAFSDYIKPKAYGALVGIKNA